MSDRASRRKSTEPKKVQEILFDEPPQHSPTKGESSDDKENIENSSKTSEPNEAADAPATTPPTADKPTIPSTQPVDDSEPESDDEYDDNPSKCKDSREVRSLKRQLVELSNKYDALKEERRRERKLSQEKFGKILTDLDTIRNQMATNQSGTVDGINKLYGGLHALGTRALPVLDSCQAVLQSTNSSMNVIIGDVSHIKQQLCRQSVAVTAAATNPIEPNTRAINSDAPQTKKKKAEMTSKKTCYVCDELGHPGELCPHYKTATKRRNEMTRKGRCFHCGSSDRNHSCRHANRQCQHCPESNPSRFHMNGLCINKYPDHPQTQNTVATGQPPQQGQQLQQQMQQFPQQPQQFQQQYSQQLFQPMQQFFPQPNPHWG